MPEIETPETKPAPTYHLDRASRRTEAERQAHFEFWWEKQEPYRAAVTENGGTPLTQDEGRELFMRRYTQPAPPEDLTIPTIRRTA